MKDKYYVEYRDMGLSVAYFRKAKGMTQQKLAEKMDVNYEDIIWLRNLSDGGVSSDTCLVFTNQFT